MWGFWLLSVNIVMGFWCVVWCDLFLVWLEWICVQIVVDVCEVMVYVFRNWYWFIESVGILNDLCGVFNKGGDVQYLVGVGFYGYQVVVGDQGGGVVFKCVYCVVVDFGCIGCGVFGVVNVFVVVDCEFVDVGGNWFMGDGEYGCLYWVVVDYVVNVVECVIVCQVQVQFG